MFSLGSLWLIFLLQTGAALEYPELYTHSAQMGSSTTIPCKFNVDAIPPAQRSFTMLWHFQEKEIFRSPNAPKAPDPRLSIDQDRIQDGIADLSMSRVSISDGGLYICSMVQILEKKVKEIRLDIHAPPQTTITNKTALINKESVLRCAISGFYPVDIDIKWLRNGEMLDNVTVVIPQRGPDGTYSVNSSVAITPTEEDRKRTFSYRIQHESLTAPFQEDFRLVFGDEEITNQNIIIISITISVSVVFVVLIVITVIMCSKRGGRRSDKEAENQDNENHKLTSGDKSGDVRQPRDSINDTNKTSIMNQQPESPDTTVSSPGDVRQPRDPINDTNKTSIRNQQPEPQEEPNDSQKTKTKPAVPPKPPDTAVSSPGGRRSDKEAENQDNENTKLISGDESGDVRQPRDSINDTNKISKRNQHPEHREKWNHSQKTNTKPAGHRKPPDTTVSSPGDVRQPRDSINDTNKTSIRNQQPEHREKWNHSQKTGTRSAVPPKPSHTAVSSPGGRHIEEEAENQDNENTKLISGHESGDVRQPRDSINDTNKISKRNQQPEPREKWNHSQKTGTRSAEPPKPSHTAISSPGNPSLMNQRSERHQTMRGDPKAKQSANNQGVENECSEVNVKNLKAMFQK